MTSIPEITAEFIARQLDATASLFEPDELAYLALTRKPEEPIRDRLAWILHKTLPYCVVSREWARRDLVILNAAGSVPLAVFEAKAFYTANAVTRNGNLAMWETEILKDLDKARADAQGAPVFELVFVTHPKSTPANMPKVVKYLSTVRAALKRNDEAAVRQLAAENVQDMLSAIGPVVSGTLAGGTAFGAEVDVDFWVVGPVAQTPGSDTGA
jgi:hypothetical protein